MDKEVLRCLIITFYLMSKNVGHFNGSFMEWQVHKPIVRDSGKVDYMYSWQHFNAVNHSRRNIDSSNHILLL